MDSEYFLGGTFDFPSEEICTLVPPRSSCGHRARLSVTRPLQKYSSSWRLVKLVCLFLAILSSSLFAESVSSTELIKNSKTYDGRGVTYEGEVIGDVMLRGEFGWINVTDGENTIGIWCKKEDLAKIKFAGSYGKKGDRIKVSGIFYKCCSQHQGELDIHAQELEVIESGMEIAYPLNEEKAKLVVILALTALGFIFLSSLRRSSIKKPPESTPPPQG